MRLEATNDAKLLFTLGVICLCLFLVTFSSVHSPAAAQTQSPPADCPRPYSRIESSQWVGRTVHHTLSAGLTGGDPPRREITYKWKVSPGKITSGQGSHSITVEMPECDCDVNVLTEVNGLEAGCQKSVEWGIHDLCFYPVSVDNYGDIGRDEEKALLSKHVLTLKKGQCWQMRITAHGKEGDQTGETLARAEQAKEYIVSEHGVEADRVTVVDGGPQDEREINLLVFHGRFTRKEESRP
jgi:hypothetical protein